MSSQFKGRTLLALPLCLLTLALAARCGETGSPNNAGTAGTSGGGAGTTGNAGTSGGGAGTSGNAGTSGGGAGTSGGGAGTTGNAGTSGGGAGTTGTAGTTGNAGTSGGGAGATGNAGTSGGGAGTGSVVGSFTPCSAEPAATVPALKRGPAVTGIVGQAGQMVGVPGEPNVLYVIGHKNGNIYTVQNGTTSATPFVHVDVATGGNDEQGLLSMALHPNFATNKLFYLFYTAAGGGAMTIDEFERTSVTAATFKQNIYSRPRTGGGAFHNGGSITFNPKDGMPFMYFAVGNTESNDAGNPNGSTGRVLRIDVASKAATTWAYGLRNPYRMSIDRLTGDMFIADVANGAGGTIIFNPGNATAGKDFLYRNNNGNPDVNNGVQRDGGGAAIIGGYVYRGNKIPGLCGRYFYGTWDNGTIKSIVVKNGARVGDAVTHTTLTVPGNVTSFGEDGEGELWMASQNQGSIYKIEAGP